MKIDLLTLVDQGGCSAKLPAEELQVALEALPKPLNPRILVDIDTHDDAGVYMIREDYALIQTTDFFPPVCSDPYDFGQIAAANALSDVYAMGGEVLTALNIVLFPVSVPLSVLKDILRGGQDKVGEAGGVVLGGHTIADDIPKYGLAVTGWIHPDQIVTNSHAKPGEVLILTKPLGTGIIVSGRKNGLAGEEPYEAAIAQMKQLNDRGAVIMRKHGIRAATDITGFGLLGHAKKMADGSGVSIHLEVNKVPALDQVMELIEMGCIPGAAFRNQEFCDATVNYGNNTSYNSKMLLCDAQTSGGLLICAKPASANAIVDELRKAGYPFTAVVGEVTEKKGHAVSVD